MVILSYFGTKLVANINDYSVQKSMETKRKNNVLKCLFVLKL